MTLVAPDTGIVTPEAVLLEFTPAGVGSRVFARVVDLLVIAAAFYTIFSIVGVAVAFGPDAETAIRMLVVIAVFVAFFGYPTAFEVWARGRTVGKMALGLRVVTTEGGPVRLRSSATRAMLDLIDVYLTLGGAGIATMMASPRGQRLGDMAAGTIVIRERHGSARLHPVTFHAPPGLDAFAMGLDVSRLRPDQYALVRATLLRLGAIRDDARWSLAIRLADRVATVLGHPRPVELHPADYLLCVAVAYQRRFNRRPAV